MKRSGLFLLVALVGLLTALVGTGVASADHEGEPHGAVVINDGGCTLLDGDGNLVAADSSHAVVTGNTRGNGVLVCKASGVDNTTGKAARLDNENTGLLCSTPAGSTDRWHATVSKSGNATLVCHAPTSS